MKTNFTSKSIAFVFAFTTLVVNAQPVLTSSSSPIIGDIFDGVVADTNGWNPGPSGANVIWDFSSLVTKTSGVAKYVSPSSTPYASQFTNSNLSLDQTTDFSYYDSQDNAWYITGTGSSTLVVSYTDKQLFCSFPFTYLDSLTDIARGTYAGSYYGYAFTAIRSINAQTKADGYGTLKLPGNIIYDNVLRLKAVSKATDTITIYGIDQISTMDYTEYYWCVPGIRPWMLYMSKAVSKSGVTTKSITYMTTSIITDNFDNNFSNNNIQIFPNPAAHYVTIDTKDLTQGTIDIFNQTGALVKRMDYSSGSTQISTEQLDNGIYMLKMYNDSMVKTSKLIIAH